MKKKIILILLAALMITLLTGCSGGLSKIESVWEQGTHYLEDVFNGKLLNKKSSDNLVPDTANANEKNDPVDVDPDNSEPEEDDYDGPTGKPVAQYVIVLVKDGINIRKGPGTEYGRNGLAKQGEMFEVLDCIEDDFTWYQIGEDKWLADDGSWLEKIY